MESGGTMKQPATDHISGSIARIEIKVKNGKPKIHRIKAKTLMTSGVSKEAQQAIDDNIKKVKRDKTNLNVRNDINPAKGAHNVIADTKKKISDEIKKDTENF